MRGYYNNPVATEQCIDEEGWLHTGDLGTLDENDYCKITGRLKDMVIRGVRTSIRGRSRSSSIPTPPSAMCR